MKSIFERIFILFVAGLLLTGCGKDKPTKDDDPTGTIDNTPIVKETTVYSYLDDKNRDYQLTIGPDYSFTLVLTDKEDIYTYTDTYKVEEKVTEGNVICMNNSTEGSSSSYALLKADCTFVPLLGYLPNLSGTYKYAYKNKEINFEVNAISGKYSYEMTTSGTTTTGYGTYYVSPYKKDIAKLVLFSENSSDDMNRIVYLKNNGFFIGFDTQAELANAIGIVDTFMLKDRDNNIEMNFIFSNTMTFMMGYNYDNGIMSEEKEYSGNYIIEPLYWEDIQIFALDLYVTRENFNMFQEKDALSFRLKYSHGKLELRDDFKFNVTKNYVGNYQDSEGETSKVRLSVNEEEKSFSMVFDDDATGMSNITGVIRNLQVTPYGIEALLEANTVGNEDASSCVPVIFVLRKDGTFLYEYPTKNPFKVDISGQYQGHNFLESYAYTIDFESGSFTVERTSYSSSYTYFPLSDSKNNHMDILFKRGDKIYFSMEEEYGYKNIKVNGYLTDNQTINFFEETKEIESTYYMIGEYGIDELHISQSKDLQKFQLTKYALNDSGKIVSVSLKGSCESITNMPYLSSYILTFDSTNETMHCYTYQAGTFEVNTELSEHKAKDKYVGKSSNDQVFEVNLCTNTFLYEDSNTGDYLEGVVNKVTKEDDKLCYYVSLGTMDNGKGKTYTFIVSLDNTFEMK